ncbi:MAG TPA: hypothetical protein VIS75_11170 [Chitinophagaceae bacterium]
MLKKISAKNATENGCRSLRRIYRGERSEKNKKASQKEKLQIIHAYSYPDSYRD